MGGRELRNETSSLAGINGNKDYTCRLLYVCVCFVYEFVYKYVLNQIPLSPAVAPLGQHPTTTEKVGLYIAQSMTPGWRVLRSHIEAL